jgi:hypothetical protein
LPTQVALAFAANKPVNLKAVSNASPGWTAGHCLSDMTGDQRGAVAALAGEVCFLPVAVPGVFSRLRAKSRPLILGRRAAHVIAPFASASRGFGVVFAVG